MHLGPLGHPPYPSRSLACTDIHRTLLEVGEWGSMPLLWMNEIIMAESLCVSCWEVTCKWMDEMNILSSMPQVFACVCAYNLKRHVSIGLYHLRILYQCYSFLNPLSTEICFTSIFQIQPKIGSCRLQIHRRDAHKIFFKYFFSIWGFRNPVCLYPEKSP